MRVLHVVQAWSMTFGGVQAVGRALVRAQAQAGLEVEIATTNIDTPRGGVLDVPLKHPVEWQSAKIHYFPVQCVSLLFSMQLRKYLSMHCTEFDLIHIHGLYRFPPTYAAYVARKQGVPYIICPHGSLDPYLYKRSTRGSVLLKRVYERLFDLPNLNHASAIHFTAEEERESASFLGLSAPSFVIPNGIDWESYKKLPERGVFRTRHGMGNGSLVLFLGRVHFTKGLDLLIPAFARVLKRHPDAHLAIVGPDNDGYGAKVRGWVTDHGLNEWVHFVDQLHDADVTQAYVDADVFVLPSYTENFGMTVVEAMACKLPVVISDQVNIHNEVTESGGGLVTHCDVDELAKGIAGLLGDADKRRSMGESGRTFVRQQYSLDRIVARLTKEYEFVIARGSGGIGVAR